MIEILLALVVISLGVVSLIAAFATSISTSADHRSLATLDTLLKSFAETATFQIQQSSSPLFATCATPTTYSAISSSFTLPAGDSAYKVPSVSSVQYSTKSQSSTTWASGSYLTSTLNAGTPATTLTVNALPAGVTANDLIAVGTGNGETTFTATQTLSASTGPTTISVVRLSPSTTLTAGSNVYDQNWSGLAGCPTNSIAPQQITATASGPGGITSSLSFVVDQPDDGQPQFSPPTTITVLGGSTFNIPVTATGGPIPTLTEQQTLSSEGGLPSSVYSSLTWNTTVNGTGTLSGTAPSANGSYSVATITATNGVGSSVSQVYTLVVGIPPAITSAAQVSETPGSTFTFTVTATGSPIPAISASGLPAGVTFTDNDNQTATLSGTAPTTLGSYPITISASNNLGTATQAFTLIVSSPPTITTASLATADAGQTGYSQSLAATGGTTPYTWSISSGVLPSGLTIGGSTGIISGNVSSTAVTQTFTVEVTDAGGLTGTKSFTLTVNAAPTITTGSLPAATKTGNYSQSLAATGGTTPYTWSISSGGLPSGLTIGGSTGTISGTVSSTAVTETFTVQVSGANGASSTKSFTITVNAVPNITTTTLPAGTKTGTYSQTLGVSGGTTPLTWSLASGVLPTGLTLGSSSGVITGTISSAAVSETFTVQVTDANGVSDTQSLSITVNSAPTITTTSLAVATDGQTGYSQTLAATGGTTPYTWSISSGTLPTGLTLSATSGVISGNVGSGAGSKTFTVQVKDANGVSASLPLTLTVNPAPNITTTSLPGGTKTGSYSQTLTASGGTTPLTWSVSTGILPTGLNLSGTTGVISGTISGSTETFTVKATDANGVSDTQSLTITVNNVPNITTTSLPAGTKTGIYAQTLGVSGGTTPFTWSLASGVLPTGLTLGS